VGEPALVGVVEPAGGDYVGEVQFRKPCGSPSLVEAREHHVGIAARQCAVIKPVQCEPPLVGGHVGRVGKRRGSPDTEPGPAWDHRTVIPEVRPLIVVKRGQSKMRIKGHEPLRRVGLELRRNPAPEHADVRPRVGKTDSLGQVVGIEQVVVIHEDEQFTSRLPNAPQPGRGEADVGVDDDPYPSRLWHEHVGHGRLRAVVHEDRLPAVMRQRLGGKMLEAPPEHIRPRIACAQNDGKQRAIHRGFFIVRSGNRRILAMPLQIETCRSTRNYPLWELVARVGWAAVWPAFAWSPRVCWGWRNLLLRLFGAKLGRGVRVDPSTRIFAPWGLAVGDHSSIGWNAILYNLGPMEIGARVTISQGAHLCGGTHDHTDPTMPLRRMPIVIGDEAWVCADAFIGPGVSVGPRSVVGARAVAIRDVPADMIAVGNPAAAVRPRVIRAGAYPGE
jgi:putative colanic acid biosynthesis acetyltransferase WcaF